MHSISGGELVPVRHGQSECNAAGIIDGQSAAAAFANGVQDLASVVAFTMSERPELFEGGWYTDSYISPKFKA